jgi:pimeloyl-ACP methyl ester carboxylesterase
MSDVTITHQKVDAGGLRVHLAQAGPQDAPAVLLLHGWPQTHHLWRHVGPALATDHRVLMPDLRGFGETQAPGTGMDPETFATDQIALLDALGIERVALVGHDWGGYAGFLLAARHPDRVTSFLACNTPHPWLTVTPRVALQAWRSWYAVMIASPLGPLALRNTPIVAEALRRETGGGTGLTDEDLRIFTDALRPPERARASQLLYRSYLRTLAGLASGRDDPVPHLTMPHTLLFGRRDQAISPVLVEDLPGVVFVDAGHFVVDERPDLVVAHARELFAQDETTGAGGG